MRVLQTTLLTGPYDWDPAVLSRAEFDGRLAKVRAALAAAGAEALLVHGYAGDYGALAYLTGFVPKLGPALALVPREGGIRLLVSGTELMLPQAKLLTWVEDVRPFANVPKGVVDWLGAKAGVTLAAWGAASMAQGLYHGIAGAIGSPGTIVALDDALDPIRRCKSPREIELMRDASRILGAASAALASAAGGGAGARSAALAAERAAIAGGAQDARSLVSLRPGGTPLPLDGAEDRVADPLLAAIFVQYAGYWVEGLVTVASVRSPALAGAEAALGAVLAQARPGASGAELLRTALSRLAPCEPHPMMGGAIGSGIGLSLAEGPVVSGVVVLAPGATYSLRVGARGTGQDAALLSAMIAVKQDGVDILWPAPCAKEGG